MKYIALFLIEDPKTPSKMILRFFDQSENALKHVCLSSPNNLFFPTDNTHLHFAVKKD
jgi:hypothetical protein